jgi:hypothetical protein
MGLHRGIVSQVRSRLGGALDWILKNEAKDGNYMRWRLTRCRPSWRCTHEGETEFRVHVFKLRALTVLATLQCDATFAPMPIYKNRPPMPENTPVWRYLSLSAVIATIEKQQLRLIPNPIDQNP